MRAILCKSYGPPENLCLEQVDDPIAGEGEAVIEVYSAALNFPDGLQIRGQYQFQPEFPFTPGMEISGIIKSTGPGFKGLKVGDRVLANPMIGGFAEQVIAEADAIHKIPDSMDFNTAAGFSIVYTTSYYALKQRADIKPGEVLLVLGASGGVGLTAVELGKLMGARVIAAASSDSKLQFVKQYNPDHLINYSNGDLKEQVNALTNGRGADVIYDPVGGDLFDQCCRCINWNGRHLVIGFTSGRIPQYKANLALLKGSSMVGVFLGRYRTEEPDGYNRNFNELFSLYSDGKIKPIVTASFPLERYVDAFNVFTERKAQGKVVLELKTE